MPASADAHPPAVAGRGTAFSRTARVVLAVNVVVLLAVGVWFRCRMLGTIPGLNGDEAWYGVRAWEIIDGGGWLAPTPTGNLPNPFFLGPLVLLQRWFGPSIGLLRSVALASGLAALAFNWFLCRWVFDRRTAWISTVALATLPVAIAYSRFAWDTSQTLPATLLVLYLSLAAVRFPTHHGKLLAAALGALGAAVLVHPTNIFAAAAPAAAAVVVVSRYIGPHDDLRPRRIRRISGLLLVVIIVAGAWAAHLLMGRAGSNIAQRVSLRRAFDPASLWGVVTLCPRLFTGDTVYRFIPGSHVTWLHGGWGREAGPETLLFWGATFGAAVLIWRRPLQRPTVDRVLIACWAVQFVAFALLAGRQALIPQQERFGLCLIAPTIVVLSRGLACWAVIIHRRAALWAGASIVAWLLLAGFQHLYFDFFRHWGGRAAMAFRTTERVEPKVAAWSTIRAASTEPCVIVAGEYWNYWPLRYLAWPERRVRVLTAEEAQAWAEYADARRRGAVWHVEFDRGPALAALDAELGDRPVERQAFHDPRGIPIVWIIHELGRRE